MDNRAIAVFDSGLGGLTAVKELRKILPGEDIVFFGDTARVPYGTRSRETILQYARQDIRFLLKQDVKFLLAACGTISSTYPTHEAARLPVPYTGVVSCACRAAAKATRNGKIGVIGTSATLRDMDPRYQITSVACPLFVPLVENGFFGDHNQVSELVIAQYLEPVKAAGVDTLILGCTHYPLVEKNIQRLYPGLPLIDPADQMAKTIAGYLQENGLVNDQPGKGTLDIYTTGSVEEYREKAAKVGLNPVTSVQDYPILKL